MNKNHKHADATSFQYIYFAQIKKLQEHVLH